MTDDTEKKKLVIAGGGTGGHLFPAVAVAEEFLSISPGHEVLFINAGRPLDRKILGDKGYHFVPISVSGINRVGVFQKIKGLFRLPGALFQAMTILREFKPQVLFSVGGYSAVPAALGAKLLGIPVILHEQNSVPGLATRLLARIAAQAHVSFPDTPLPMDEDRYFVSGNPVRQELFFCRSGQRDKDRPMTLLILGGSQGAHAVNEAVCRSLPLLKKLPVHVIHQTGTRDLEMVRQAYEENGIAAEVLPFIDDMKTAYGRADLALCRAGATTVAELAATGLGAILVPFPAATDNHQFYNAKSLVDVGAGIILEEKELSAQTLAAFLADFAENPGKSEEMGEKALLLGRKDAAKTITRAIMHYMPE